jgi:hypothetical protein
VSFGFFSGFYGIRLAELQIDPRLESMIRPKDRGLHSIWNAILRIAFSIWFLRQDNTSTIEDLQKKNSGMLGNYSRISWSTFQPWDASSTLEDFWLVEFGDALLTVYFGAPIMFITLWFGFDYGTNPPLGTLIM